MRFRTTLFAAIVAVAASSASVTALADGEHKPKYGGIVSVVKDVQYELVAKPGSVAVFIEDHGKKVDTKGATAKLTLLAGSEKTDVVLSPAGENGLEAKGTFKVAPGTKAVATIALAGKPATSVRFEIK